MSFRQRSPRPSPHRQESRELLASLHDGPAPAHAKTQHRADAACGPPKTTLVPLASRRASRSAFSRCARCFGVSFGLAGSPAPTSQCILKQARGTPTASMGGRRAASLHHSTPRGHGHARLPARGSLLIELLPDCLRRLREIYSLVMLRQHVIVHALVQFVLARATSGTLRTFFESEGSQSIRRTGPAHVNQRLDTAALRQNTPAHTLPLNSRDSVRSLPPQGPR